MEDATDDVEVREDADSSYVITTRQTEFMGVGSEDWLALIIKVRGCPYPHEENNEGLDKLNG